MVRSTLEKLIEMGAVLWETTSKSRLYLNKSAAKLIGFEVDDRFLSSGQITHASLSGVRISSSRAAEIERDLASAYVDMNSSRVLCCNAELAFLITQKIQEMDEKQFKQFDECTNRLGTQKRGTRPICASKGEM